ELSDVYQVEKFGFTDADYDKRTGTRYGAFLKWNKRCKFAEQAGCPIEPEHPQTPPSMKVSDRCEVPPEVSMEDVAAGLSRRMKGTIGVVGNVEFKAGFWVGMDFAHVYAFSAFTVLQVVKYFSCPNKHGVLVWPDCVVVGDFPEEDLSVSEDEM
ncbi:uncharacterized protein EV422DRAFT_600392, partial [Fimicolochytrium jonesii]|uniref:uncharacterized protein n=1 Tax=Fimicolochytrium jonesii TaxID=1396493 RepID=UPI0022FEE465